MRELSQLLPAAGNLRARSTPPNRRRPTEVKPARELLAVALGVFPIYGFVIGSHLTQETPYSLQDLFIYPLMVGSFSSIWMLFLYTSLCREKLGRLNLRPGSLSVDLLTGIAVTAVLFAWRIVESFSLAGWIPREPPAPEIITLLRGVAESPWLLALWLGPVVWIGVACFEELSRVFLLNRFWKVWPSPASRWIALCFSAVLFGLAHLYQGPAGAVSNGVIGVILGVVYLRWGRVGPLIVAHGLFDSIQVALAVMQLRGVL